jgi:UDP-N-acetylmuramoylalanine-D-glutamate ligase
MPAGCKECILTSEVSTELAGFQTVGISGSHGKTTTLELLTGILRTVRANHFELIMLDQDNLDQFEDFAFNTAVILNIEQNASAAQILQMAKTYNNTKYYCIYNAEDAITDQLVQNADVQEGAMAVGFTKAIPGRSQIGVVDGGIVDRAIYDHENAEILKDFRKYNSATSIIELKNLAFLHDENGEVIDHLLECLLAAVAILRCDEMPADVISLAVEANDDLWSCVFGQE